MGFFALLSQTNRIVLKKFIGIFTGLFLCSALFAQEGTVSGTVSDKVTGETLIGATVIYEAGKGVTTDIDGNYSLKLPFGTYTFKVSYVGYKTINEEITVDKKFVRHDFALSTTTLREIEVVADLAIEKETPVAYSNITPLQIKQELGTSDLPLLLNTTPGVYVSPTGGADGGARISIRGFQDRNVTVMIDGIPINNMDNGNVFWASTFGIDGVLANMQVQRGMTSSRLAIPAIGGTVNFITKSIENKESFKVQQDYGSFNTLRTSVGYNSGKLKGGWGVAAAGSFRKSDGYSDQQYKKEFFYYLKVQKQLGNHVLSLSAMGSPVEYGQRRSQQKIVTYDKEYARRLFKGNDALYQQLADFNVAYNIQRDNSNDEQAEQDYINLAEDYGWGTYNDEGDFVVDRSYYEQLASENDFIDTTGVISKGLRYNNHWGYLNGDKKNESVRKYNKPIFSIRDFWAISDKVYLSNVVYYSYGKGGSTARVPRLGFGDYDENLQVNFQAAYNNNTIGGIFGPPIYPEIDSTGLKSSVILNESFDNHYWIGWLSTLDYNINDNWKFAAGLDFRTYRSEQYQEIHDLLGGDYYVPSRFDLPEDRSPKPPSNIYREGDKYNYYNDNLIRWGAFFTELKYNKNQWRAFVNLSGVVTGYKRKDYFKNRDFVVDGERYPNAIGFGDVLFYNGSDVLVAAGTQGGQTATITQNGDTTFVQNPNNNENGYAPDGETNYIVGARRVDYDDPESKVSETPWKNIPGYTIKAGTSYLLNEFNTVFINAGYISRTPRFRNVVDFGTYNEFVRDIENENISSVEIGYTYSGTKFSINANAYYTYWKNRPTNNPPRVYLPDRGITVTANLNAMNAIHQGFELNSKYLLNKKITLEAIASIGDWRWDSAKRVIFYDDQGRPIHVATSNGTLLDSLVTIDFDAKGVAVGDAPQTQIGGAINYAFVKNGYVKLRYMYFGRYYSDFDPLSLVNENKGRQSWQIPSYGIASLYAGYRFDFNKVQLSFNASVENLFDKLYLADASNNNGSALVTTNYLDSQQEVTNNFDANSSSVYVGLPRRFSISAILTF